MIAPRSAVRVRLWGDWVPAIVEQRARVDSDTWRVRLVRPVEVDGERITTLVRHERDMAERDPPDVISCQAAPHPFRRRSRWRWWICRHCYAPRSLHPRRAWVKARPLGDNAYLSANAPHFTEGW